MTSLKVKMYVRAHDQSAGMLGLGFGNFTLISNLLYLKQIATNCNDFAFFLDVLRNPTNFSKVHISSEGKIKFGDISKFYLKLLTT